MPSPDPDGPNKALACLDAFSPTASRRNPFRDNLSMMRQAMQEAAEHLDGWDELDEPLLDGDLRMRPRPDQARAHLLFWLSARDANLYDLTMCLSDAGGYIRGYLMDPLVSERYVCSTCGARGVKLWRGIGDASEAWCSKCGMAQAGYEDTVDALGKHTEGRHGISDQIYNPEQGQNLLPYVPAPNEGGGTWGYTSVPPEGCLWWQHLPTRVETP